MTRRTRRQGRRAAADMTTAQLCAVLMSMAYGDISTTDVESIGMRRVKIIENGAAFAALVDDGSRVFIVFRGTNDLQDLSWDFKFTKTKFERGGRVHRGFLESFMRIWPDIEVLLGARYSGMERIATGHSLGGTAVQLAAASIEIDEAHVFGCPRVGNRDFVGLIECPGTRWETRFDVVTGIPLRWGPWQAISAIASGRMPSMFRQPPVWDQRTLNAFRHPSDGYLKAMMGLSFMPPMRKI